MSDKIIPEEQSEQTCKNCLYWAPPVNESMWRCKRNPPTPMLVNTAHPMTGEIQTVITSMFPQTAENEWCGEFYNESHDVEENGIQHPILDS